MLYQQNQNLQGGEPGICIFYKEDFCCISKFGNYFLNHTRMLVVTPSLLFLKERELLRGSLGLTLETVQWEETGHR